MLANSHQTLSTPASPEEVRTNVSAAPRIALFIEEAGGDWHARRLSEALVRRGASVATTTLRACAFDTKLASGIDIPGFGGELPDGAFVRSISKGSLEQITLRLGILHALAASGVRVWNEARVIERAVDKSTATFLFQRAGLPVPITRTAEGRAQAIDHFEAAMPMVLKPLFGSQGNGVSRIDAPKDLPEEDAVGGVYYLQEHLRPDPAPAYADLRVLVSGGRILGAMQREGEHWVTNVHRGAKPRPVALSAETERIALRAAAAIGADYAGVDLIKNTKGDTLVLEVNSNPAWKGLQSIVETDIADALAEDFLSAVLSRNRTVCTP